MTAAHFLAAAFVVAVNVVEAAEAQLKADPSTDCAVLFAENMSQFMTLTPQEFDFDKTKGWRKLSTRQCYSEAAEALSRYVEAREVPYHVYFHAGQLLATAGRTPKALEMLEKSLRPGYDETPFKWNSYVRAIQAFLRNDRSALVRERESVAARVDVKGNEINLRVLDKLVENFGSSYRNAVRDLE